MAPEAILISKPVLNTSLFLRACNDMLGYSPARKADAVGASDQVYMMACFSAFANQNATAAVKDGRDVYGLQHYVFLIVGEDVDMFEVLNICSGMEIATTETTARGIIAALIGGSLRQWRTAAIRGCRQDRSQEIRACFDKVYVQFAALNLADVFARQKRQLPDQTFYLEDR